MLREEEVDLEAAMADAAEDARPAARDRQVTVEIARGAPLPPLLADRRAMQEILYQLFSNAVKFTQPNGYVNASAQVTANGEIAVVIADTGVGIAPEDQTQMFDRFGRGQHDVARTNAGAGLGLPIVKGLVELHGGRIALSSAPGEGTRVSVFFPAERVVSTGRLRAAG